MSKARIWCEDLRALPASGYPWFRDREWHYRDGKYWVNALTFDALLRGINEIVDKKCQSGESA